MADGESPSPSYTSPGSPDIPHCNHMFLLRFARAQVLGDDAALQLANVYTPRSGDSVATGISINPAALKW